jgi:hypothetical protein
LCYSDLTLNYWIDHCTKGWLNQTDIIFENRLGSCSSISSPISLSMFIYICLVLKTFLNKLRNWQDKFIVFISKMLNNLLVSWICTLLGVLYHIHVMYWSWVQFKTTIFCPIISEQSCRVPSEGLEIVKTQSFL